MALFGFSAMQDASGILGVKRQQKATKQEKAIIAAKKESAEQTVAEQEKVRIATEKESAEQTQSVFSKLTDKQIVQINKVNMIDISTLLNNPDIDTQITKIYKGVASTSKLFKETFGDNGKLAFNWKKGKTFIKAVHECRSAVDSGDALYPRLSTALSNMLTLIDKEETKGKIGSTRKKFLDPDMQGVLRYEYAKAGDGAKALIKNFYSKVYGVEIK